MICRFVIGDHKMRGAPHFVQHYVGNRHHAGVNSAVRDPPAFARYHSRHAAGRPVEKRDAHGAVSSSLPAERPRPLH